MDDLRGTSLQTDKGKNNEGSLSLPTNEISEKIMISVLILTKNEEQDLPGCLDSVSWCDDIHVFDSYSSDNTIEIARKASARVTQRQFDNWAAHQNWALANIPFKYNWVFYLDADERVSPGLKEALLKFDTDTKETAAYEIQRRDLPGMAHG